MRLSRRFFLKTGGIAVIGLGAGAATLPRFLVRAAARVGAAQKTLVVIFQRGAADGLNIVVPHAEKAYYKARPSIAIPRPKPGDPEAAIDLDGFFGLHPSLAPFKPLYDERRLAVIHAVGSPDATRSHFDAQDFMETGTPGIKNTRDGWLNRYLQANAGAGTFRGVSMTSELPRVLAGTAPALAMADVSGFGIPERRYGELARRGLEGLYGSSADPLLRTTARETFEAVDLLQQVDPTQYEPVNGAVYPGGDFGDTMLQIAQLIKSDIGLEIAFAEIGGWDHHVNEGGSSGALANLLGRFGEGIGAFVQDLGQRMDDVVLVTLSEFGRTAAENGNRGTDHGHANAMFVIGGALEGGRVYGSWPGLQKDQLYESRDLALTTDFRDVLGEVLAGHFGAQGLETIFPGHPVDPATAKGLFRA
jgi:uncharacterized protein (DUF1501 family)